MATTNNLSDGKRDLRLDLFRGLANWAIFLDHIPNNVVAWVTTKNYGFSDAADFFVFVSGYTVAFVYGPRMIAGQFVPASVGILARAWQIYVAHILLFVIYVAAIGFVAQQYNHAHLLDEFNIRRLIADPIEFLKHGLLLEFKPFNLDVLPLYIGLMAVFPVILWCLARQPKVTLLASFALYFVARWQGLNLPAYPDGSWYFNPFAWQLLFVIGAWLAIGQTDKLMTLAHSKGVIALAVLYLCFSLIFTLMVRFEMQPMLPSAVVEVFYPNDKTNLALSRITHLLALALIVSWLIPRSSPVLRWPALRPVLRCGQRSLEVFCFGIFLAFVARLLIELVSTELWFQIAVSMAGIGAMIGLAYFRTWSIGIQSNRGGAQ